MKKFFAIFIIMFISAVSIFAQNDPFAGHTYISEDKLRFVFGTDKTCDISMNRQKMMTIKYTIDTKNETVKVNIYKINLNTFDCPLDKEFTYNELINYLNSDEIIDDLFSWMMCEEFGIQAINLKFSDPYIFDKLMNLFFYNEASQYIKLGDYNSSHDYKEDFIEAYIEAGLADQITEYEDELTEMKAQYEAQKDDFIKSLKQQVSQGFQDEKLDEIKKTYETQLSLKYKIDKTNIILTPTDDNSDVSQLTLYLVK